MGAVPGARDAYVATGHSVWGILHAPATGEAMAELILNGAASMVDLSPFDPARLAALDPERVAITRRLRGWPGPCSGRRTGSHVGRSGLRGEHPNAHVRPPCICLTNARADSKHRCDKPSASEDACGRAVNWPGSLVVHAFPLTRGRLGAAQPAAR
jgi:hypothetical protein